MKKDKNKVKLIKNLVMTIIFTIASILVLNPLIKNINLGLDLQGGFEILYKVESVDGNTVTSDMVKNTYKTILKRIDTLGVSEPSIIIEGNDRIRVGVAGITDQATARNKLSKVANLTFRDTSDNLLMTSSVLRSGGAKVSYNQSGLPVVALSVSDKDKFFEVTKNISKASDNRIVIWLDFSETDSFNKEKNNCGTEASNCLSVASVSQGFASDVIIDGTFTLEQVKELVELINSGSLPTKLEEISSKTVEASFGADSLEKTYIAGITGILAVIVFMIFVYKFAGFIASVGIVFYTLLTFLIFWLVGGVLTLPGIAAMVIGIGMAVDSCVINFSRIKDCLKGKERLADAFVLGYKESFLTILDANLTTLISAIILFLFGESSVKGFATMLIISVIVTMFVMVFVVKNILKLFVDTKIFNNSLRFFIGYKESNKANIFEKIDFVKYSKQIILVFIVVMISGALFVFKSGLNLGIDFKGGTAISLRSENKITDEDINDDIKNLNYTMYDIEKIDEEALVIKIEESLNKDEVIKVTDYFKEKYEAKTDLGVVSNIVKQELIKNAFISFIISMIGIMIYVAMRFKFSYALTGIVALIHDVFIIIVIFSILKLEVSSIFVAALLSITGYSINDTIVIFSRIRETIKTDYKNKIKNEEELSLAINNSLRQTLMRSLITTVTTIIPVVALITLGSHEIFNFNIALLFGLISGTISSAFLACQLLILIEKSKIGKEPKKKWYEEDEVEETKIKGINY